MYSVELIQKLLFVYLTGLAPITIALTSQHIRQISSILPRLKQLQNLIHTPQHVNTSLGFAI